MFNKYLFKKNKIGKEKLLVTLYKDINDLFLTHLYREEIIKLIPDVIADSLDVPIVMIEKYDEKKREMLLLSSIGVENRIDRDCGVPVSKKISGHVAESGKIFSELNLLHTEAYNFEKLRENRIKTFLSCPICINGRVWGTLSIGDQKQRKDLIASKDIIELLGINIGLEIRWIIHSEKKGFDNQLKIETVIESMNDGVFISNVKGELVDFNSAWAVFSRFKSKEECIRKLTEYPDLFEVFKANGEPALLEEWALSRALRGEKKHNIEYRIHRKDTGEIWSGSYSFSPILDQDGKIDGAVVVARDITDIKRNEYLRRKLNEKAAQSNKLEALGTLAGGIAHDFNNLLYPIVGMSELLMEDLKDDSTNFKRASDIQKAGVHAKNLVKQILSFSRQSGFTKNNILLQPVIEEVVKLNEMAFQTGVKIIKDLDKSCGYIEADSTKIHQVVMNLLTNAVHSVSNKAGGQVLIKLEKVKIKVKNEILSGLEPGEYACITVVDNGIGIKPEIKSHIFDPYFTTKKEGKGVGLGLSVTFGIISDLDGYISVKSQVDEGAAFSVYFPLLKECKLENESCDDILEEGCENIFVVDDNEIILALVKEILERLKYTVFTFTNGFEAIEAIKECKKKIDLVITDMSMPELNGLELAEKINNIQSEIPILIFTGYSEELKDEDIGTKGIKGVLMKPVVRSEMARKIREILDAKE